MRQENWAARAVRAVDQSLHLPTSQHTHPVVIASHQNLPKVVAHRPRVPPRPKEARRLRVPRPKVARAVRAAVRAMTTTTVTGKHLVTVSNIGFGATHLSVCCCVPRMLM